MSSLRRSQSIPSLTWIPQGFESSNDAQTPADGQRAKGLSEPKAVRVDIRQICGARVEDWVQVEHPVDRPISADLHNRAVYRAFADETLGPQPLTNASLGRWLFSVVVSPGFWFTSVGLWIFFVVLSPESAVLIIALAVLMAVLCVCGFVVAAILS